MNNYSYRVIDNKKYVSEKDYLKLKLQRDVLALNRDTRDSQVVVILDSSGEVLDVGWPEVQSASQKPVNMPAYANRLEDK